jgi:hypothetical protein
MRAKKGSTRTTASIHGVPEAKLKRRRISVPCQGDIR